MLKLRLRHRCAGHNLVLSPCSQTSVSSQAPGGMWSQAHRSGAGPGNLQWLLWGPYFENRAIFVRGVCGLIMIKLHLAQEHLSLNRFSIQLDRHIEFLFTRATLVPSPGPYGSGAIALRRKKCKDRDTHGHTHTSSPRSLRLLGGYQLPFARCSQWCRSVGCAARVSAAH